ncbi:hypothetical protein SAMN05414139_10624 [Burkholderia sp. D7]|nr:hypothetical protein SAMN05414139_10624 [Burkholderia sp. D7]
MGVLFRSVSLEFSLSRRRPRATTLITRSKQTLLGPFTAISWGPLEWHEKRCNMLEPLAGYSRGRVVIPCPGT